MKPQIPTTQVSQPSRIRWVSSMLFAKYKKTRLIITHDNRVLANKVSV
jgi:hypothetical protein